MLNFWDLILVLANNRIHGLGLSFKNPSTSGSGLPHDLRFRSHFQTILASGYLRLLRKFEVTRILESSRK